MPTRTLATPILIDPMIDEKFIVRVQNAKYNYNDHFIRFIGLDFICAELKFHINYIIILSNIL